jgi:hypothetical protein
VSVDLRVSSTWQVGRGRGAGRGGGLAITRYVVSCGGGGAAPPPSAPPLLYTHISESSTDYHPFYILPLHITPTSYI